MRIKNYELVRSEGYPALLLENSFNYPGECRSAEEVVKLMREVFHLHEYMDERLFLICCDGSNKPIGFMELSHGGYDFAEFDTRGLFTRVLLLGASSIFLAHNHPSGTQVPSKKDVDSTEAVGAACKMLGINLLDHVIICGNEYFSFHSAGLL